MESEPEYDEDFKQYAKELVRDIYNSNYAPKVTVQENATATAAIGINPVLMHQLKKRRLEARENESGSELER
jgi:hypothetical protein